MDLFEELASNKLLSVITDNGDISAEMMTTHACGEEGGSPC